MKGWAFHYMKNIKGRVRLLQHLWRFFRVPKGWVAGARGAPEPHRFVAWSPNVEPGALNTFAAEPVAPKN